MSQKFSLEWNDYHSNWTQSLSELRNDQESGDVTLISEDKVKFTAHKIILSSCSKMFKFILKGNIHANPLMFLSGVSSVNLGFILDFIYFGEVNLEKEQLNDFLESAKRFEIEGLQGDNSDQDNQDIMEENDGGHTFQDQDIEHMRDTNEDRSIERVLETESLKIGNHNRVGLSNNSKPTFDDIEMKKTENYSDSIKKPVAELCNTCTFCNKEFKSKASLTKHKYKIH